MHLQIEFFVTTANEATATRLGTVFSEDMERFKGRFNAGSSVDARGVYMVSAEESGLTPAPTTLTPTFNADAMLSTLEMKHTSSGNMIPIYQSRAGPSTELFIPAWYSYGATLASIESSASIDLSFVPTYSGSTVSVKKGDHNLGVFTSNVTIALDHGSYSLALLVTNGDSGAKLEYYLQVVFPYPTCSSTALGPW